MYDQNIEVQDSKIVSIKEVIDSMKIQFDMLLSSVTGFKLTVSIQFNRNLLLQWDLT